MSEHQDAIDTVLHALRTAEPTDGFEARMHHALQQGAAPRRTWRMPFALMTAVALLLCAIAIGLAVHARHADHAVTVVKPYLKPSLKDTPAMAIVHDVAQRRSVQRMHAVKLVRTELPLHADADAVMTHENMPPPPLPLTQQERLVIRMMRHNDLPQLAALSTDARARSLHDDAETYRAFFAPRPPLDGQPMYQQHIISGGSQ